MVVEDTHILEEGLLVEMMEGVDESAVFAVVRQGAWG
jgi:hypothetical protein